MKEKKPILSILRRRRRNKSRRGEKKELNRTEHAAACSIGCRQDFWKGCSKPHLATDGVPRSSKGLREKEKMICAFPGSVPFRFFGGGQLNPLFAPGLKKRTLNYGASLWVGEDLQIT